MIMPASRGPDFRHRRVPGQGEHITDQRIIYVEPVHHATPLRLVERCSERISSEKLGTAGADSVVRRILDIIQQRGIATRFMGDLHSPGG